jgi:hypothetical protein
LSRQHQSGRLPTPKDLSVRALIGHPLDRTDDIVLVDLNVTPNFRWLRGVGSEACLAKDICEDLRQAYRQTGHAGDGRQPLEHGDRQVRKAIDPQYLARASWQGQKIKCADKLSNTKDIVADDLRFARVYVPEKKLLIDELTNVRKVSYPI